MLSYKIYTYGLYCRLQNSLKKLNLLPLLYIYELSDIMFFIKSIKASNSCFDISNMFHLIRSSSNKLYHKFTTNSTLANSYFLDFLNCGTHSRLLIYPSPLIQLKANWFYSYRLIFIIILIAMILVLYTMYVPIVIVISYAVYPTLTLYSINS